MCALVLLCTVSIRPATLTGRGLEEDNPPLLTADDDPLVQALLHDLEQRPAPVPHRARADDRAQRTRDPTLAADHLADVVLGDVEDEHEGVVALLRLDPHGGRVVDELAREVRQQLRHA